MAGSSLMGGREHCGGHGRKDCGGRGRELVAGGQSIVANDWSSVMDDQALLTFLAGDQTLCCRQLAW